MAVIGAVMVPHPPIILPEIGRGEEKKIQETADAYRTAMAFTASLKPETVVIASPHSVMYGDYFHISPGVEAEGDFRRFRARNVYIHADYDYEFVHTLCGLCDRDEFPGGTMGERDPQLDHGTMIPLYFLNQYLERPGCRVVRIGLSGLPLADHYRMGLKIREAAERLDRRVVFIASGDLSHKLREDGPYGFDPSGPVIMAGALDGKSLRVSRLSHQGTFGVGYGVCIYQVTGQDEMRHFLHNWSEKRKKKLAQARSKEDLYVRLARAGVESAVRSGRRLPDKDIAELIRTEAADMDMDPAGIMAAQRELLYRQAGVFVSIHKNGSLRGCIGTISPTCSSIAREIAQNAVSASTKDPRFSAIRPSELDELEITVDVLGETEKISSPDQLDVKRYGVIVSKGRRRGLLLPNLDGVDTVEEQIGIALQKAGLDTDEENYELERFEVVRHY